MAESFAPFGGITRIRFKGSVPVHFKEPGHSQPIGSPASKGHHKHSKPPSPAEKMDSETPLRA